MALQGVSACACAFAIWVQNVVSAVKTSGRKQSVSCVIAYNVYAQLMTDNRMCAVAGALGVVGLAVAVGGLVISSLGGSGGGGRGSSADGPTRALLDRVPEPLPVTQKLQQAGTQVATKRKLLTIGPT